MDIHFRRLLRSVLGLPSQTNLWHEIFHDWNARVARYVQKAGVLKWSQRSLQQHWHLCSGLPDARWVSKMWVWRPRTIRKRGAAFRFSHSAAETFCRWKQVLRIHNVGTNILQSSAPSSSRVAVAYVRFRLYKRLCLERVPRANAPLVYRFHSLTHPPSLAYMEIALSWNTQRFARLLFVMYSGWLTRSMCCIMLPPAVNLRMTCYYLQIPALKCHKFWINSWKQWTVEPLVLVKLPIKTNLCFTPTVIVKLRFPPRSPTTLSICWP